MPDTSSKIRFKLQRTKCFFISKDLFAKFDFQNVFITKTVFAATQISDMFILSNLKQIRIFQKYAIVILQCVILSMAVCFPGDCLRALVSLSQPLNTVHKNKLNSFEFLLIKNVTVEIMLIVNGLR